MVPDLPDEVVATVLDCNDPGKIANYIAYSITLRHMDRQRILEELHPVKRLKLVNEILTHELDVISLEVEMEKKVRDRVGRVQKDMILREQVKVLQHELGEDGDEEIQEYTEKVREAQGLRGDRAEADEGGRRGFPSSPTAARRRR